MNERKHSPGLFPGKRSCMMVLFLLSLAPAWSKSQVAEQDSITIGRLLDSAIVLEGVNREAALQAYREIVRLSEDAGYTLGKAKALHYAAIVYSDASRYDESLRHYLEAVRFYKDINNGRGIGACYGNIGNLFLYQGKLDSALAYYHIGIKFFEQHDLRDALSQMYGNTGLIFQRLKQYDKAAFYFDRSLDLAARQQDSVMLCRALTNKATLLFDLKKFDESIQLHKTALSLAEKIGDTYSMQNENINLADCYQAKGLYHDAVQYGMKAMEYALRVGTPFDIADVKKRIGDLYLAGGNTTKAEHYYLQAIAIADSVNAREIKAAGYYALQDLYARINDFKQAYAFQSLAKALQDSILSEKQLNIINEIEARYQAAQKDKQLAQNKLQLQESRQYVVFSTGAVAIALLIILLFILYYRYKRKTHLRQLESVEREKEVQVLQAAMQGEEKERSRIAYHLHDEVSGMLAAAKMHLNTLAAAAPVVAQNNGYQKTISLLDETSTRVRTTAHNLLPEVLMQNGLEKALERYCQNISNDERLVIRFYSLEALGRFQPNFELAVYRIVQELLNNIIKHAKATNVLVQTGIEHAILFVTVEDNGVGFAATKNESNGIGLKSLQHRIKALSGKMDISSQEGEGASIYLEFEIANYQVPVTDCK